MFGPMFIFVSLCVSGASGARWMGRRPSHCRKQPQRAQHHTHCSRGANEQPTGGTQLWGTHRQTHTHPHTHTHTHTHITYTWRPTSFCCELFFVIELYCLIPQAKVSPNFKNNYSETLAKLEHQYCKLLVSLRERTMVLCVCVCVCVCVCARACVRVCLW